MPGVAVPAVVPRHGVSRHPRDDVQFDHEVRRGHPKGSVRQHGAVGRHDHVPGHRGPHAKGDHGAGAVHDEDQDDRAAGAQVLRMDRRLHLGVAVHVPADVDLQDGVRRERAVHCAPQVLLDGLGLERGRGRGRRSAEGASRL